MPINALIMECKLMTRVTLLTGLVFALSASSQTSGFDETEFVQLHKQLAPTTDEGWSSIPWKTSLVQACVQAVREKKPLFMVCRAGHPLGCV
jgi:hypothetical protein